MIIDDHLITPELTLHILLKAHRIIRHFRDRFIQVLNRYHLSLEHLDLILCLRELLGNIVHLNIDFPGIIRLLLCLNKHRLHYFRNQLLNPGNRYIHHHTCVDCIFTYTKENMKMILAKNTKLIIKCR